MLKKLCFFAFFTSKRAKPDKLLETEYTWRTPGKRTGPGWFWRWRGRRRSVSDVCFASCSIYGFKVQGALIFEKKSVCPYVKGNGDWVCRLCVLISRYVCWQRPHSLLPMTQEKGVCPFKWTWKLISVGFSRATSFSNIISFCGNRDGNLL